MKSFTGTAHVYGDNIDTDRIIPGKYTKTLDTSQLAAHVLEDLDPQFAARVQSGDIVVAGENFGCGSSREQAPIALKAAGVSLVVAEGSAWEGAASVAFSGWSAFRLQATSESRISAAGRNRNMEGPRVAWPGTSRGKVRANGSNPLPV